MTTLIERIKQYLGSYVCVEYCYSLIKFSIGGEEFEEEFEDADEDV